MLITARPGDRLVVPSLDRTGEGEHRTEVPPHGLGKTLLRGHDGRTPTVVPVPPARGRRRAPRDHRAARVTRRAAAGAAVAVVLLTGCAGTAPPEVEGGAPAGSPPAGSAPATHDAGQRIDVTVAAGRVGGDTGRVPVSLGETVTLTVTGDAADEVHLHGYDLTAPLAPGRPATLTFVADVPGVFEAELHGAGTVLLTLQVG
ncbi:hypothetical protein SAMN05660209_03344 [Geodermatophilus africanus]|uniref:Cupredoxin-like domain-containing protein n=1 Tax=Geodermatophilus africanus TaxID=1137993 RepID=A0A1H3LIA2_9ACTN|nr:hypothetical protein [Geodermatophilus africanus]SDY63674.1 hypothetical protein SAMN05660209_03344 [Geodermatophilus africanus]